MMEQLKYQREELLKEKQRLELSLQEEWNKKLEEKDKSLGKMQEELRTTLEEEIRKKEEMMLQQLQTQRESLQVFTLFIWKITLNEITQTDVSTNPCLFLC